MITAPAPLTTILHELHAISAELNRPLQPVKRPACRQCGIFYAEPGERLCRPCIDTAAESEKS